MRWQHPPPLSGWNLACGWPRLGETAIRGDKVKHRHDELGGIGDGLAALVGQNLGIGDKIAVERDLAHV